MQFLRLDGALKMVFHIGLSKILGKIKRGTCGINSYGAVTLKAVKTTGVADDIPEGNSIIHLIHED